MGRPDWVGRVVVLPLSGLGYLHVTGRDVVGAVPDLVPFLTAEIARGNAWPSLWALALPTSGVCRPVEFSPMH